MMDRIISDISSYIFVSDTPQKVDAVFLPGGTLHEQPVYAAELYHRGLTKWIIPSGGVGAKAEMRHDVSSRSKIYNGKYRSECDFFTDVLSKNSVPMSAIIGENKAAHTRDNAFLSRKVLDESGVAIETAVIVCKAFHARRCLMLYQMAFPEVEFIVCPVHCYGITKNNWYKSEKGIDRVFGELARCGSQFVVNDKVDCQVQCNSCCRKT